MAEILNFRIKNYRSIKDSGICYLSNDITVLAGKNESGKTSILEALEDFDTEKKIKQKAKPISDEDLNPEILVSFKVDKKILVDINENLIIEEPFSQITIKKDFENNYSLNNMSVDIFKNINNELDKLNSTCSNLFKKIKNCMEGLSLPLDLEENKFDNNFKNQIQNLIPKITDVTLKEKAEKLFESLKEEIEKIIEFENIKSEFVEEFKSHIPYFIFFNTYKDQKIPNEVPFTELESNEFVQDLVQVSNLDLKLIKDVSKSREQATHNRKLNINLVREYQSFWEQDLSNINIDWKDNKLYFWVTENDEFYPPELRSKGKQWHLAFYIKVTARAKENKPNVLLIDEPGLFLHAKAQKDILKKLEESSKAMQIIYSTHSPYLIDSQYLNRVRLVERNNQGTKILKLHAKADKETLTPILTAIGDDLSQGIRVDKRESFVVEGISDYFYIQSFRRLFNIKKQFYIVPGCGDNLPSIGGILFGWGLNPKYILDTDKTSLQTKLKRNLSLEESDIIPILDKKGMIEEIFSENDFKRLVLEDESIDISKSYIKGIKAKGGKELVARKFFQAVEAGNIKKENLDDNSKFNIKKLLNNIQEVLEDEK